MASGYKCRGCGRSTGDVNPYSGLCRQCEIESKAAQFDLERTKEYMMRHIQKAGLDPSDPRIRLGSRAEFENSVMAAKLEDLGHGIFEREKEVARRELELQGQEEALREAPAQPKKSEKQALIQAKKERLAELKRSRQRGGTGEAQVLIREIEVLEGE